MDALDILALLFAIILGIVGLVLLFDGNRRLGMILGTLAFGFFATIALSVMNQLKESGSISLGPWPILGIALAFGILGALLASMFEILALAILGACAGFLVSAWAMQFSFMAGLAQTYRTITIVVFIVVFVILVLVFRTPVVVVATAIAGSAAVLICIDYFLASGFADALRNALVMRRIPSPKDQTKSTWMLWAFIGLAILGMVVQFSMLARFRPKNMYARNVGKDATHV